MNPVTALNTYKTVGIESGVAAADPHKLILMLYQGALLAIAPQKIKFCASKSRTKAHPLPKPSKSSTKA